MTVAQNISRLARRIVRRGIDSVAPREDKTISLTRSQLQKIEMVSRMRGESFDAALRHTINNLLLCVPTRVIDRNVVRKLDFMTISMEDGLTKLVLANGRTCYGYPSRDRYVNIFNAFRDLIPNDLTGETYQAAADASFRYQRGAKCKYFPGPGGVVIEGGGYIGYKAVRFAEVVGDSGRVIAIEIGRRNHEIMCRNIAVNGLGHIITPVHCGIWSEPGSRSADLAYPNSYHLATPDEHDWCTHAETVPTDTLDNIIDRHNLETVDFLNLQLNGAEYEGLLGLRRRLDDVKILRIAAYYTRDGVPEYQRIIELLESRGCTILEVGSQKQVIAATSRFAREFKSRGEAPVITTFKTDVERAGSRNEA